MEYTSDTVEYSAENNPRRSRIPILFWFLFICIDFAIVLCVILYILNAPPDNFPLNEKITIEEGASVRDITKELAEQSVVKSETVLYATLVYFHDPAQIKASTYTFREALTTQEVARALMEGDFDTDLISVTFPEGFSVFDYNEIVPDFLKTEEKFVEGTFFPDTYFVPQTFTGLEMVALLESTFEERISDFEEEIQASGFTQDEIIILASLIEREANDSESMGLVSGILRNRLEIGMPLQVDASVAYGLQISGTELTRTHLQTDGPYNTYTRTGLPAGPIANPGIEAITAALQPIPSEYFYYITGNDGIFYYAETLREHNLNVARHLR